MTTLNIADLHQEAELTPSHMASVVGGHDIEKEKALVELYNVLNRMNREENEPDSPPAHVSMHLPG